jgi:CRP-like cAMP-binding protein
MATDRVATLGRVPALAGLDTGQLEAVSAVFRERTFEAGSTVIREGERGARVLAFFIIVDGSAAVSAAGTDVATLGPGDHFGEVALFCDVPRTATVRAVTDLSCLALSSWEFRPFVESHPAIAWKLLETMAIRMTELASEITG